MKTPNKITKTMAQTSQNTSTSASLRTKLKACDPDIKNYVEALTKENLKLHKEIAKCQANNVSLNNRIKVLEKEQYRPKVEFKIQGLYDEKNQAQKDDNQK